LKLEENSAFEAIKWSFSIAYFGRSNLKRKQMMKKAKTTHHGGC